MAVFSSNYLLPTASITPRRSGKKLAAHVAPVNHRAIRAAMLDRMADAELGHGHHQAAEYLAHRAAYLREAWP